MTATPKIKGLPILGNLLEYRRNKIGFLSNLRDQLGDQVHFKLGKHPLLLMTHPDDIHWIEMKNAKNYVKATNLRELVGDGIITSEGEKWRKQRRLIQPNFHQGNLLKMVDQMNDRIKLYCEDLDEKLSGGPPNLELSESIKKLVFEIMGEVLLGIEGVENFSELRKSMMFINTYLTRRFGQVLPIPTRFPTWSNLQFHRAKRVIDQTTASIIESKLKCIANGNAGDDLISKMILARDPETGEGMSMEQLRDEVVSIMLAGFETTGHLLPWILHSIAHHPESKKALRDEIDQVIGARIPTGEEAYALPVLGRIVDEVLRLYPPVWAWTKRALGSDQVRDLEIKTGDIIYVSPYLIHRHPAYWDQPNEFNPNRWTPELKEKNKNAFFPFGMGPRNCVGRHFALLEVKLILIQLFQKFEFTADVSREVKPDFQVTLGMNSPLHLILNRRST
jgi:cytochrome P450